MDRRPRVGEIYGVKQIDARRRMSHRAAFGFSLLVALGWYVTVPAAGLVARTGIPAPPQRDCVEMFSCLSPGDEALLLLLLYGLPVVGGTVVMTFGVSGLLSH